MHCLVELEHLQHDDRADRVDAVPCLHLPRKHNVPQATAEPSVRHHGAIERRQLCWLEVIDPSTAAAAWGRWFVITSPQFFEQLLNHICRNRRTSSQPQQPPCNQNGATKQPWEARDWVAEPYVPV